MIMNYNENTNFGRFLKTWRGYKHYNQSQAAAILHVSRHVISDWENQKYEPKKREKTRIIDIIMTSYRVITDQNIHFLDHF